MFAKRLVTIICLWGLWLAGCAGPAAVPTPDIYSGNEQFGAADNWADDFKAEVEWSGCPFEANPATTKCGYLNVPANYTQYKNGQTLKLAFVQFQASSADARDDAILVAAAYPFAGEAEFVPYLFDEALKFQDVVVFDVRGVGLTESPLTCPNIAQAAWDAVPLGGPTPEEWGKVYEECHRNLEVQSFDLASYSLSNMANDLHALRLALQYPAWNVIAFEPIGAYLAYEQLRSDPQGIRSLIFDGAVPNYTAAPSDYGNAQRVIHDVFALCGQDEKCNAMFPDLETVFYKVAARLNKEPVFVDVFDLSGGGRRATVLVDGNYLIGLVLNAITYSDLNIIGTLPRLIYQLDGGTLDVLKEQATRQLPRSDYSYPLLSSLALCRHLPLATDSDVNAALAGLPEALVAFFQESAQAQRAICNAWQPSPVAALPAPSASLTPILLVQGEWVWEWGSAATVEALTQAAPDTQVVKVSQSSITILFSASSRLCGQSLLVAFTANPEAPVDASCMPTELNITWITLP